VAPTVPSDVPAHVLAVERVAVSGDGVPPPPVPTMAAPAYSASRSRSRLGYQRLSACEPFYDVLALGLRWRYEAQVFGCEGRNDASR
jgi:hypothetical protein